MVYHNFIIKPVDAYKILKYYDCRYYDLRTDFVYFHFNENTKLKTSKKRTSERFANHIKFV